MGSFSVRLPQSEVTKLAAALGKYAKKKRAAIRDAVNTTAVNIESEAKRNVQKNDSIDTGRMLNSIHAHYAGPLETTATVSGGGTSEKATHGPERGVSALVDYATFVEFGTSRQIAKPFMHPAAEAQRKKHKERVSKALKK